MTRGTASLAKNEPGLEAGVERPPGGHRVRSVVGRERSRDRRVGGDRVDGAYELGHIKVEVVRG